jgi:hypothetical protein
MRYYYICPDMKMVVDNARLFVLSEFMATQKQENPTHGDEVIMWAVFPDLGSLHAWESMPGVEPLPDPMENDPLSDAHMTKLNRFHDLQHGPQGWADKGTGAPANPGGAAPHTRKLMQGIAQRPGCMPSFKFRLFASR